MANEDKKSKPDADEPDEDVDERDESEEMDPMDEIDALDEEISELKAYIAELEEKLEGKRPELSSTARWASWILGGLVGATCLALIVMFLGGGYPEPCECPESGGGGGPSAQQQQQQQAALERLLRANSGDFQDCFESWASSRESEIPPGWAVIVRLEIAANDDGEVQNVDASGNNLPEFLGRCLEEKVQRWTFPGPGPFTMELPFAVEGGAPAPRGSDAAPATGDGGPVTSDAG